MEISKVPATLLTKKPPTRNISPNIAISDVSTLSNTQPTQETHTSPSNTTTIVCYTFTHQKLTMDPTIAELTIKYCDTCKLTVKLEDTCWKTSLPFLPPQPHHKMQQYNFNHGSTPKILPTRSSVLPPPYLPPHTRQQHQHPFPSKNPTTVPTNPHLH